MTEVARYFMSAGGPYADSVVAREIPSRQAALRYGWFIDADDCAMVYVRRGSNGKSQHFRRLDGIHPIFPGTGGSGIPPSPESPEHVAVKVAIAAAVNSAVASGTKMPWGFRDKRFYYPFTGDLIEGVSEAATEFTITFPDGRMIRPDISLIGSDASGQPIVRWAIEVMRDHELDMEKMMKIYSMGLPTMVVDIAETKLSQVTPEWAASQLLATCKDDPLGRRPNFIHLPDTLRTVLNDWSRTRQGEQHKFVIFGEDERVLAMCARLRNEAARLRLPFTWQEAKAQKTQTTDIAAPANKNEQTEREFQNARKLVPNGWVDLAGDRYLRIITPRPSGPGANMDFHLLLAHLVAADGKVIMGYDSKSGMTSDPPLLAYARRQKDDGFWESVPLAPRVLSFPIGLHRKNLGSPGGKPAGTAGT